MGETQLSAPVEKEKRRRGRRWPGFSPTTQKKEAQEDFRPDDALLLFLFLLHSTNTQDPPVGETAD
jgi:hypothetical protein